jgi:hypothetical protein
MGEKWTEMLFMKMVSAAPGVAFRRRGSGACGAAAWCCRA